MSGSGSSSLVPHPPGIGRAEILRKYWELANLDPEITKGTITGQLKALDSLCEELALEESGDDPEAARPQQQIYRSAWLRLTTSETSSGGPAGAQPPAAAARRAAGSRVRAKAASKKAGRTADDE